MCLRFRSKEELFYGLGLCFLIIDTGSVWRRRPQTLLERLAETSAASPARKK